MSSWLGGAFSSLFGGLEMNTEQVIKALIQANLALSYIYSTVHDDHEPLVATAVTKLDELIEILGGKR